MTEKRLSTTVLVIGTGGSRPAGVDRAGRGRRRRHRRRQTCQGGHPHSLAAGGINAALATMDPEDSWQQHAADTLKRATCSAIRAPPRSSPRARPWGSTTLSGTGWPSPAGGRPHLPALLRRPQVPADRLRRRLHGPEIQRTLVRRASQLDIPLLDSVHHAAADPRRRGVRRVRLSTSTTAPATHPRGRRHLAAGGHTCASGGARRRAATRTPWRLFRLAVEAGARLRDPGTGAVSTLRHHRAGERGGHAGRQRPRRGRHPAQRARRAVHDPLRPRAHGTVDARPRGAGPVHRDRAKAAASPKAAVSGSTPAPPRQTIMQRVGLPDPPRTADARHHA